MTDKRVALVTGANKGIGFEIARQLAQAGVHVVIGARDDAAGHIAMKELLAEDLCVSTIRIDLNELETVLQAVKVIHSKYSRLDILVNNAGTFDFTDGAPSVASIDAVRRVLEINFVGALAVTQAMLPLLRKAPEGRIVNLSSSLGSLALNADVNATYYAQRYIGYNASKAALNMLTIQLNEELRGENIKVNSVSPGFVKTSLTGFGDMTPEEGAKLPVQYALAGSESGGFFEPDGKSPW